MIIKLLDKSLWGEGIEIVIDLLTIRPEIIRHEGNYYTITDEHLWVNRKVPEYRRALFWGTDNAE